MTLPGRRIVLGVSGGIATYKCCILVRRLREAGADVEVVMTRGARRFVGPVTFEALSGRPVHTSLWAPGDALAHVRLAEWADLLIVAPATAHLIARAALGLADDLLTSLLLARTGPVLLAPAMNDAMYAAPPVQARLADLRDRGWHIIGPDSGPLAEGESELPGRMSEPEVILRHAERLLRTGGILTGLRVLVTAGSTREPIDPVRVISNRSSGRMGFRLAEAAWARGAEVSLITGPSTEAPPPGVETIPIETTTDLAREFGQRLPDADVVVMAAAPADYRPATAAGQKLPRVAGAIQLALTPTEDILSSTRERRKPGAVIVGFALETGDAIAGGRAKLERKGLDLIVVNDALEPGAGFEVETNRVTILHRREGDREVPLQSKAQVAEAILDAVEAELRERASTLPGSPG